MEARSVDCSIVTELVVVWCVSTCTSLIKSKAVVATVHATLHAFCCIEQEVV